MKRTLLFLLFAVPILWQIQAQTLLFEVPKLRIGVEAGVQWFDAKTTKPSQIRENRSSYYYGHRDELFYCGFVRDERSFSQYFVGIKPEYSLTHRLTIASGLRFSIVGSQIVSDRDFFLWRISQDETHSNYLRISELNQKSYYFGIPLELRFFPRQMDCFVRQYFVIGAMFNFHAFSNTRVDFINENMQKYQQQIENELKKPDTFSSSFYLGVGLKLGKMNRPFGNLEFQFPIFYLLGQNKKALQFTSFLERKGGGIGGGFNVSLKIPIPTKQKLQIIDDDHD